MKNLFQRAFILPLILIIAVAVVVFKVKSKPPIEHEVLQFPTRSVEVIEVRRIPFRTRVMAYGNVEPSVLMTAKAEVAGKISYIHPALKKGGAMAKGTVALRIEPTTFEFSVGQKSAALAGSESALVQLAVEEEATRSSLVLAKKNLEVGQKELDRQLSILEKNLISRSVVDTEEQKVLQLRQLVEDLQGKLSGYASRRSATQAQIRQSASQLAQSQDTLGRTEVLIPFDARIGAVSVEEGEFTPLGSVLFEASGTAAVEINAQLPTQQFRPLLLSSDEHAVNIQTPEALQSALSRMQLQATVTLVGFEGETQRWQAQLVRIGESIDPARDTIGLVVAVKNPYDGVIPGKRPPLLKGMYAAVEFKAPPREALIIPRKALHQGRVYVARDDNTLEIRPVNVLHKQGRLVEIDQGLVEGERIIITDVIPVIQGLPLSPIVAEQYATQLAMDALSDEQNETVKGEVQ